MSTDAWGVTSGYRDAEEVWHDTAIDTHAAILASMGVASSSKGNGVQVASTDPVLVVRRGERAELGHPGELTLEDGTVIWADGPLPVDLPLGYHTFQPEDRGDPTRVIVSPGCCLLPSDQGTWGWAVQLYATRSEESWGIGDLADLRRLANWSRGLQAGLLLVNPLAAPAPLLPQQASPYYPTSRRFRNPLYLRVEEAPGADQLGSDLERLANCGRELNRDPRIDRDAVFQLKQQALDLLWAKFIGDPAFDKYRQTQGRGLEDFAVFSVLCERLGGDWRTWPESYRQPEKPAVRRLAEEQQRRVLYHQWLQWLLDEQLARASAELPIMHDLPIGVDPGGADAWAWQEVLAQGCSVGAPPDVYNTQGQDWGLPPFVPHKLRAAGYEPFIQTIRAVLRHAGGLRIDHVMGLFRLYWIPSSFGPKRGAFVRYRADEMMAIVALESRRAGAYVVGEDLGTVEDGVREQLAEHNILSYRLLWFEDEPPVTYPKLAMVAATTHDLPTIAGLWTGKDLADQQALGLEPSEAAVQTMRSRLADMTGVAEDAPAAAVIAGAYETLAQAPSLVVTATLEDALGVEDRTNMPGTIHQWPNWSVALPGGIEALEASPLAEQIAASLRRGSCASGKHC